jgi:hypothetical protein
VEKQTQTTIKDDKQQVELSLLNFVPLLPEPQGKDTLCRERIRKSWKTKA